MAAAILSYLQKVCVRRATIDVITVISRRARSGRFIVKNRYVHEKLNIKCMINIVIGKHINLVDILHLSLFNTLKAAVNIARYKIGQTTPNTQLGGVKGDLLSDLYHC